MPGESFSHEPQPKQQITHWDIPDVSEVPIIHPEPGTGETVEQQAFPEQPRLVGNRMSELEFHKLLNVLEQKAEPIEQLTTEGIVVHLDPDTRTAAMPPELKDMAESLLPIFAVELEAGTRKLVIKKLTPGSSAQPIHADFGDHEKRLYLVSNKEGQTTNIVNQPSVYRDEAGNRIDHSNRVGWAAAEAPPLPLQPGDIWSPPALTFVQIYGDTLHARPEVDPDRRAIEVVPV
ncbi:MAG TPA: hypothetical protein VK963_00945 [Candidatus Saccharimonadales bacterium]|nr:hypothetical protein [Candidatus Saccharimonadales bacterium]